MADVHVLRFKDGPLTGKSLTPGVEVYGWPLPERLCVLAHPAHTARVACWREGDPGDLPTEITESPNVVRYVKIRESDLPDDSHDRVMRGAEYELAAT